MRKRGRIVIGVIAAVTILAGSVSFVNMGNYDKTYAADEKKEEKKAEVKFSKDSGSFKSAFDLELTSEEGCTIYYTTDCSVPDVENGNVKGSTKKYTGKINIKSLKGTTPILATDKNASQFVQVGSANTPSKDKLERATIIRAIAVDAEGNKSSVATRTYFIDNDIVAKYKDCAVMSIVTDPSNLLDGKNGIYVLGDAYNNSSGSDDDLKNLANFMQHGKEYERPAYMDFFNNGKDTADLSQGIGIRIHGGYSRRNQQKSLNIYFRKDYDYGTKNLKGYDLLPGNNKVYYDTSDESDNGKVLKYSNAMLRNGGNDVDITKFQDAFIQGMVTDKNFGTQSSRPCMLYLNGEYWGLYNLTEKYSDSSLETEYGVDKDNVIVYKDLEIDEGEKLDPDGAALTELLALGELDMTVEENYKKFQDMVDIDSYVDYVATEIYINNNDWWSGCNAQTPHNNIEFWKVADPSKESPDNPYADGKWRYLLFDTEWSMGLYSSREAGAEYDSIKYHAIGEPDQENNTDYDTDDGQLRKNNTGDPVFAALFKNSDFRQRLVTALLDIRNWNFDYNRCVKSINSYIKVYSSLMDEHKVRWKTGNVKNGVNTMSNFLKRRPDYVLTMLENDVKELCKKNDRVKVTVSGNVPGTDYIDVNTLSPEVYSWLIGYTGTYYKNVPVTVNARDIEGYEFDKWEIYGGEKAKDVSSSAIAINLTKSEAKIRAVYRKDNGEALPSPSIPAKPTDEPLALPTDKPGGQGGWNPWNPGGDPWNPGGNSTPKPSATVKPTAKPTAKPSGQTTVVPSTAPSQTPAEVQNNATTSPSVQTTAAPVNSATAVPEAPDYKIGGRYTVGKAVYKILTDDTAAYIKPVNKTLKSCTVAASVKICGRKFKVTKLADKAFLNNKKLTKVIIGSNVLSVGKQAFKGCNKLRSIIVKSADIKSVGSKALSGIYRKAVIKVPASKVADYKKVFAKKGQKSSVKIKK